MITLTGGSGFIGTSLIKALPCAQLQCLGRNKPSAIPISNFCYAELTPATELVEHLSGTKVIIHCAARVHVMHEEHDRPLEAFKEVNTAATLNLAKQAADAGVRRFIFISTVKVNGESTYSKPFSHMDEHNPKDSYGISKSLAETGLLDLARETGMEVVIIRPPLVYGPNVKANFAYLMKFVNKGFPLPFGMLTSNKRSMVYVENLVDLIINCLDNKQAANKVFMVSDDHDLSTKELITFMGRALGKNPWQLPCPIWVYRLLGAVTGKSDVVERLVGSLQVDIQYTKDTLNWAPPFTVEQGMAKTANAFLQVKSTD